MSGEYIVVMGRHREVPVPADPYGGFVAWDVAKVTFASLADAKEYIDGHRKECDVVKLEHNGDVLLAEYY